MWENNKEFLAKWLPKAKKNKNYARADEIRGELTEMGVAIKDTKDGTEFSLV